jgi:hypothetical protein
MELESIRKFVQDHPDGVVIRMVDGTTYQIPQSDWISFGPPAKTLSGKQLLRGTSFVVYEEPGGVFGMRLMNAMLVKEVVPMRKSGHTKGKRRKAG